MAKRRPSGDGMVRKRSDGRWEGRVLVGYDEQNRPKTKNVLAKTKVECIEKLEKLKAECGIKSQRIRPDMPFGAWIDFWTATTASLRCAPAPRPASGSS